MKLGTLNNNTRDGRLIVVSKDNSRYVESESAPTLQAALDNWAQVEPKLKAEYDALNNDANKGQKVDLTKLKAPLPRAYEWIDGSAYINHIVLVRKARNAEPPDTLKTDPLVYQGGSGNFLGPMDPVEHFSEDYGIDYEAELAVITDDVPMGTRKEDAHKHIKLIGLLNDVSLRNLIPAELKKSFGFFVSKPSTSFAPFFVTPDELGDAWKDGRVHLEMLSQLNGQFAGNPDAGPEMFFSFYDLLQHVTQTRKLTAGTIIGSGTISNEDEKRGSSCLSEKRMIEKIKTGEFKTPYLRFGDVVDIDMKKDGQSVFGPIRNEIKQAKKSA